MRCEENGGIEGIIGEETFRQSIINRIISSTNESGNGLRPYAIKGSWIKRTFEAVPGRLTSQEQAGGWRQRIVERELQVTPRKRRPPVKTGPGAADRNGHWSVERIHVDVSSAVPAVSRVIPVIRTLGSWGK
jgi:hypothetical protein